MSISFHDHATNRLVSITLNDMLNNTLGAAIRLGAAIIDVEENKAAQLSRHAVNMAQASLVGARGKQYSTMAAVITFFTKR